MAAMALKIANCLFTGPYMLDKTVLRENQAAAVFAVAPKEGLQWDPVFRLIDAGASQAGGLDFAAAPRQRLRRAPAESVHCPYLLPREGEMGRHDEERIRLAAEIAARYAPPNDLITIAP